MKTDISVIYIGGPTVIIEVGGLRIMTDPTLDPAGTSFTINDKPAYAKTDNPAITDIGRIDVVLLSHDQHGDNLDNAGRELLKTVPLTLTTVIGAGRLKGSARGLNSWELFEIPELFVAKTAVPEGQTAALFRRGAASARFGRAVAGHGARTLGRQSLGIADGVPAARRDQPGPTLRPAGPARGRLSTRRYRV